MLLQLPASRLRAETRLTAWLFTSGKAEEGGEATDWDKIDFERRSFAMYLPQSRSLHYAWLGNDGLAADYVWIKSAGYISREFSRSHRGRKFEWLKKLYNTVTDLDPHWGAACRTGATLLAAVGRDTTASLELIRRGMVANPDSWRLPYDAGHICLLSPGRAAEAVRYFQMAAQRPGRPDFIEQIIPRLMAEAGRLELAVPYARELAGRYEAARTTLRELDARLFERLLGDASRRFREAKGEPARGLVDVRRAGLMRAFDLAWSEEHVLFKEAHDALCRAAHSNGALDDAGPLEDGCLRDVVASGFLNAAVLRGSFPAPEAEDPFGKRWLYHAPTGTVRSEGLAEVDVRRIGGALQAASNRFARAKGTRAESLEELAAFFGEWIAEGRQLNQEVTVVLKGGKPPEHPLAAWGERFLYDRQKAGRIRATWPRRVAVLEEPDAARPPKGPRRHGDGDGDKGSSPGEDP